MTGKIIVYFSFCLALVSTILYVLAATGKVKLAKYASYSYTLLTAGVVGICAFLLSQILSHNFQYTYVWEYSSKELPNNLLVACFYAGQQGSFLLWTFWLTLIGFVLIPYLRKRGYELHTMGFYSLIVAFLLFILIAKSPFDYVWESFPGQVNYGFTPQNGKGLNPVLQNYWITIHPPILFLGFSSLAVPFTIALAGFFKKDYRAWINISFPWTLFSCGVLGLGLMLGGLWAYETLGWGGFWAWDPVENSSLLPWIAAASFVHTGLVFKRNGGLIKTNYAFAVLGFILVLYSSFLTRSGVLGDTSVHSFVSPGPIVYKLLLIFLLLFILISVVFFFIRMRSIPGKQQELSIDSKEFLLSIGSITLLCIGFIVFLGTSWPIMAEITGKTKASVDASWYNMINLPLAIVLLLINGASLYFSWKRNDSKIIIRTTSINAVIALLCTLIIFILGVRELKFIGLAFAVFFSIAVNAKFIVSSFRKSPKVAGAYLSHFGLALLILGALTSGGYSAKKQIRLKEGESAKFEDYTLKFSGKEQIEKHWQDREKYKYSFEINKNGNKSVVYPIVYWSDFNERKAPFFEPGINAGITQDLYISPYSIEYSYDYPPVILQKGQKANVSIDTNYKISVLKFEMSGAMNGGENGALRLGVVARFNKDNFVEEDTLYAYLDTKSGINVPEWKTISGSNVQVGFIQLIPNKEKLGESQAVFAFKNVGKDLIPPKEVFVFEASTKPFIALVWAGTIFLVFGFFLSIAKYTGQFISPSNAENNKEEKKLIEDVKQDEVSLVYKENKIDIAK